MVSIRVRKGDKYNKIFYSRYILSPELAVPFQILSVPANISLFSFPGDKVHP